MGCQNPGASAHRDLAAILRQHKKDLIEIWRQRVLSDPAVPEANRLSTPTLIDHLPDLIDRMAQVAELGRDTDAPGERIGRAAGRGDESRAHAEARLAAHYAVPSALKELSHLRAAVLELCAREQVTIASAQWLSFNADLDEVMVLAAVRLHDAARADRDAMLATLEIFMACAPVGFAVVDSELRYVRINETLARMNRVPAAEHIGRRVRDVLPAFADQAESLLRGVLETRQPVAGLHIEVPDGPTNRHLLASYYPLVQGGDAHLNAVGGVVVDITEQKRAEQELRTDADLRERFMGVLGHDLRSPLSAILLSAQALLRNEALPPGFVRGLQRIKSSARRAERLVRDLVDLVRSRQGGGIRIAPAPLDLRDICEDVVAEVNATYPERTIALSVQGGCQGRWDPDRIAQLVTNVITNAVVYSPAETPVTVEIGGRGADAVFLRVHNQGAPIPAELIPTLFDPFRRGTRESTRQSSQGLGLGLHIARQIARVHGGEIEVDSAADKGTTFTVTLPRETSIRPGESLPGETV